MSQQVSELKSGQSGNRTSLTVLVAVSGIWIGVMAWLFFQGVDCNRNQAPIVYNCMTANEIGDFLAGAFAPLAFLWLAFAFFFQSQELRLQREELELSRQVAEEAKEAIKAQATEAQRSGDYFKKQTEFLENEDRIRKQTEAEQEFKAEWDAMHLNLSDIAVIGVISENITLADRSTTHRFGKLTMDQSSDEIHNFIHNFDNTLRSLKHHYDPVNAKKNFSFDEATNKVARLSAFYQMMAEKYSTRVSYSFRINRDLDDFALRAVALKNVVAFLQDKHPE